MVFGHFVDGLGEFLGCLSVGFMSGVVVYVADFVCVVAKEVLGLLEVREFPRPPALGEGGRFAEWHEVRDCLLNGGSE